jgi:hypothetical protein
MTEARVDWVKVAIETMNKHFKDNAHACCVDAPLLQRDIAKALSAAFEKGREER